MHIILQGRRSWSFYVWTICFGETNGQKQCDSSIAFARISVYRLDNRCGKFKKTKTYGLVLLFHLQDRVAHFDRNPALPKDQPLRGSWHNEFLLYRTRVHLWAYSWTSNGYNEPKCNVSSHNNLCLYLSAIRPTCCTKAFVLCLQTVGSVATNGLLWDYKWLVVWLQKACSGSTNDL